MGNMTLLADSWSLGVLIGLPAVVILLCIGGLLLGFGLAFDDYDSGIWTVAGAAILVFTVAGAAYGFYPYSAQYHKWHETTGRVVEISSRFLGGDKSTTQKFVVRFANGAERGCLDTRCALVKVGDRLTLTCKRQWQFAGRDGWDCNYIEDRHA